MPLSRTEQSPGDIVRYSTRLRSFDIALGGGMPRRICTEIAGPTYVGKSTLALWLAALANPAGRILICPLEVCDPQYNERATSVAGHTGPIWYTPLTFKGKPISDEQAVDALDDRLRTDEEASAAIFDSIGAVSPISEQEGSVGDANMGRRAKLAGTFLRKSERTLLRWRENPANVFLTNHLHPNIGFAGSSSVGGKAIEFHCAVQLRLFVETKFEDGSILDQGTIYKNRFRGDSRNRAAFNVFIKAGVGVHPGLTALHDCLSWELAEKDQGRIKMDGKNYGFLKELIEDKWNDGDVFQPFIDKTQEVV